MTDPAIEAAQRALAEIGTGMSRTFTAEVAAREMAKTVQELHRRDGDYCWSCDHTSWPCETAKRVYPSEEL